MISWIGPNGRLKNCRRIIVVTINSKVPGCGEDHDLDGWTVWNMICQRLGSMIGEERQKIVRDGGG